MKAEGVRNIWERYKFAALAAVIGAGLLLWPGGETPEPVQQREDIPAERESIQQEMEEILGHIAGVGQVRVMLTVDTDGERQLARDTELSYSGATAAPADYSRRTETVLTDTDGGDEAVVTKRLYPTYRGALVVCQGGSRAEVRLAVTEAVTALTGLTADKVTVAEWQS